MDWYQKETASILSELDVDPGQGLAAGEVGIRQERYGPNELVEKARKSALKILWEQLTGLMIVILLVAAVISLVLGSSKDALAILAIVILNAVLGFTQEYRAEKAMAALKRMSMPHVRVRRENKVQDIPSRELVPGDIVILEAGNTIPADGRIIESASLRALESILTGESEPVEKIVEVLPDGQLSLGDRRNMVYMGTSVTYGRGQAVITSTGMETELGRIANLIQGVSDEKTPLQRRLDQLGKILALAALGIVTLVFILGLLRGDELRLLVLTAISMSVAAVPEGLPAVVTIALALGAQRMLKRRALIRKLPAVETLGSVTVICSDKTGTLTQNRMTVTVLDVAGHRLDLTGTYHHYSATLRKGDEPATALSEQPGTIGFLLAASALCNDAILEVDSNDPNRLTAVGDPTEGALVVAAAQAGYWKEELQSRMPRVNELPFDSDRKRMTTVHPLPADQLPEPFEPLCAWARCHGQSDTPFISITKGAVDGLLEVCTQVWDATQATTLDENWRKRILDANNGMAKNGMRVLGIAYRFLAEGGKKVSPDSLEKDMIFIGLVGMIDPARPEVKDAVHTCQTAGIRPIMITGDHPLTALYIGKELDFTQSDHVMTGKDLDQLSEEDLQTQVRDTNVYARVSPEHKLKIVDALQAQGQIVAMTGDGVNDAPALKTADIGVAMGITGTDVSKEASDMVLLDDNFATIVAAVEEGRRIYDNIRKFLKYTLTSNAGELAVMLFAPFIGVPLPLLPLQILWVNLVTDGLPGLGLTVEPAEPDTMRRPPFSPKESIFSRGMGVDILWIGMLLGFVSLGVGYWAWTSGRDTWQTMLFTTIVFAQMGNVLALRSGSQSFFKEGVFTNRSLLGAVALTIGLQLAVVYIPALQSVFNTVSLPVTDLAITVAASLVIFIAVEGRKALAQRR